MRLRWPFLSAWRPLRSRAAALDWANEEVKRAFDAFLAQRSNGKVVLDSVLEHRRKYVAQSQHVLMGYSLGLMLWTGLLVWLWPRPWGASLVIAVLWIILALSLPSLCGIWWKGWRAWRNHHQQWDEERLRVAMDEGDTAWVRRAVRRGYEPNALLIQLSRCTHYDSPHRVKVAQALVAMGAHPNTLVLSPHPAPPERSPTLPWLRATRAAWPGAMTGMHSSAVGFPELMAYYVSLGGNVHLTLPGGETVLEAWVKQVPLVTMSLHPPEDIARTLAALDVLLAQGLTLDTEVMGQAPRGTPWRSNEHYRMPPVMACFGPGLGMLVVALLERGADPWQPDSEGRCLHTWVQAALATEARPEDGLDGLREAATQVRAWLMAQALQKTLGSTPERRADRPRL